MNGVSVPQRRDRRACSPHPVSSTWEYERKEAICKPGNRPLSDRGYAGTTVLDLPASRTGRNKCVSFNPPSLWHFVTAALAKTYVHLIWPARVGMVSLYRSIFSQPFLFCALVPATLSASLYLSLEITKNKLLNVEMFCRHFSYKTNYLQLQWLYWEQTMATPFLWERITTLVKKNNLHRADTKFRQKYDQFFYDSLGRLEAEWQ